MAEETKETTTETTTETKSGEQNDKRLTFDEILEDKNYQSEFDKRVSKALETAKVKWQTGADTATTTAVNKAVTEAIEPLNNKIKNLVVTAEVLKAAAKDPSDIITQLDLAKVSITDDKIEGLDEQIKTIKEKKPYLFNLEDNKPKGKSGLSHEEGTDEAAELAKIRRAMGLPIR